MIERSRVEDAFVSLLKQAGAENVRRPVYGEENKYPRIVVNMVGEERDHPLLNSNVTVECMIETALEDGWQTAHNTQLEAVKKTLFEFSLARRLRKNGLNVPVIFSTMDGGLEIEDDEMTPLARSTVTTNLAVS